MQTRGPAARTLKKRRSVLKKRLFDFSPLLAVMAIASYALMLTLFGVTWYYSDKKPVFGVIFILLIVSFLFVFVYFVILSPHLEEDGVHHGARFIPRDRITCRTAYDLRFKEGAIILKDKSIDYRELNDAMKKKQTIRVQATKSNLKKLGEYLGTTLETPKKPARKKYKYAEVKRETKNGDNDKSN